MIMIMINKSVFMKTWMVHDFWNILYVTEAIPGLIVYSIPNLNTRLTKFIMNKLIQILPVDEQLTSFQGPCLFEQYFPSEPSKNGLKIFDKIYY